MSTTARKSHLNMTSPRYKAVQKIFVLKMGYIFFVIQVTAPTALFVGDSDGLAAVDDNDLLAEQLPNLLDYQVQETVPLVDGP